LSRLYFGRFLDVHIGGPSSNQATSLESQMIHLIQLLPGRTLRCLVWRSEIFVIISEHAFVFRKRFAHPGKPFMWHEHC
jgi:hypothetical protein